MRIKSNKVKLAIGIFISMGCISAHAEYPKSCMFYISGNCFGCDTSYSLELGTQENCTEHCPNRFYFAGKYHKTCNISNDVKFEFPPIYTQGNDVSLENCAKDGYFYDINNEECYSCSVKRPVWVSAQCEQRDECLNRCPNRIIQYTDVTTAYSVLKCPTERPLMDKYFACWSCDEPTPIDMSFNQEKILGAKYSKQGVVCHGQRYFKDDEILSYPCPKDKRGLSEKACKQCNGKLEGNMCI